MRYYEVIVNNHSSIKKFDDIEVTKRQETAVYVILDMYVTGENCL